MRFKRFIGACVAGVAVLASPLAAKVTQNEAMATGSVTKLDPISPWNIDYGEGLCRLARIFGTPQDRHLLFFEQAAPRDSFGVTLAGSQAEYFSRPGRTFVGLDPDTILTRLERVGFGEVPSFGPALIISQFRVPPSVEERASAQSAAHITAGVDPRAVADSQRVTFMSGKRVLSLETGSMKEPIEALNACTSELMRAWGLNPVQHENYRPAVFRNLRTVTKNIAANYPKSALVRGESGLVRMRVTVELDGTASECELEKTTIADNLESPACAIVMRSGRFDPALDKDGKPMRSFYATNITYAAQ